jgi:hypothetical protein
MERRHFSGPYALMYLGCIFRLYRQLYPRKRDSTGRQVPHLSAQRPLQPLVPVGPSVNVRTSANSAGDPGSRGRSIVAIRCGQIGPRWRIQLARHRLADRCWARKRREGRNPLWHLLRAPEEGGDKRSRPPKAGIAGMSLSLGMFPGFFGRVRDRRTPARCPLRRQ